MCRRVRGVQQSPATHLALAAPAAEVHAGPRPGRCASTRTFASLHSNALRVILQVAFFLALGHWLGKASALVAELRHANAAGRPASRTVVVLDNAREADTDLGTTRIPASHRAVLPVSLLSDPVGALSNKNPSPCVHTRQDQIGADIVAAPGTTDHKERRFHEASRIQHQGNGLFIVFGADMTRSSATPTRGVSVGLGRAGGIRVCAQKIAAVFVVLLIRFGVITFKPSRLPRRRRREGSATALAQVEHEGTKHVAVHVRVGDHDAVPRGVAGCVTGRVPVPPRIALVPRPANMRPLRQLLRLCQSPPSRQIRRAQQPPAIRVRGPRNPYRLEGFERRIPAGVELCRRPERNDLLSGLEQVQCLRSEIVVLRPHLRKRPSRVLDRGLVEVPVVDRPGLQ